VRKKRAIKKLESERDAAGGGGEAAAPGG